MLRGDATNTNTIVIGEPTRHKHTIYGTRDLRGNYYTTNAVDRNEINEVKIVVSSHWPI
jgi:hypothetical protein